MGKRADLTADHPEQQSVTLPPIMSDLDNGEWARRRINWLADRVTELERRVAVLEVLAPAPVVASDQIRHVKAP